MAMSNGQQSASQQSYDNQQDEMEAGLSPDLSKPFYPSLDLLEIE